jgi:hypothetical protein
MTTVAKNLLYEPGDIRINMLILKSLNNFVSIEDYLVELNIYENIFNNTLSGDVVLSDSGNIISELPIQGDEYLIVDVVTPSFTEGIKKTFRVTAVENRTIVRDQNTQIYTVRFTSIEAFTDALQPLHGCYSGDVSEIVGKIFNNYISTERYLVLDTNNYAGLTLDPEKSGLRILGGGTSNKVKFVSPGWTALDCINWLATKAIPKEGKACNFLFWETSRSFYFGSIEELFTLNESIGTYNYAATAAYPGTDDINEKMTLIQKLEVLKGIDHLSSLENGYFASKLIELDLINKKITSTDYDHSNEFTKYTHSRGRQMNKDSVKPLFNERNLIFNPDFYKRVYPKQPGLHSNSTNNYNERMSEIYGNRKSNILDLNSFKLNILIHGRTDIEVGRTIYIKFPAMSPVTPRDLAKEKIDIKNTGTYLITAIHHKINAFKHTASLEVIRDSELVWS